MEIKAIDSHSHIGYENDEEIVGKNIMMPYLPTFSEYQRLAKKILLKRFFLLHVHHL